MGPSRVYAASHHWPSRISNPKYIHRPFCHRLNIPLHFIFKKFDAQQHDAPFEIFEDFGIGHHPVINQQFI